MAEREMNKQQRGTVDGCFEEGHYLHGIAALDRLRMKNVRPSPSHVRQLIYISLYPPPLTKEHGKAKGKRKETVTAPASPSKQRQEAKRLQRQALIPSPEATQAARDLLLQYTADDISPEALLRAVPCYPLSDAELKNASRNIKKDMLFRSEETGDDLDSYVSKQADRLRECTDCWSMLRKDVVTRQDLALQKGDFFRDTDSEDENEENETSSVVLGKHSWHLLEWFINIFLKDKALSESSEDPSTERASTLLLSHIKPSSRSGDARSNIEPALDIVFLCYQQTDESRRSLGKQLMTLLISLTNSSDFSPIQLLTRLSIQLHSCSLELLRDFLSDLPDTSIGITMKLAICDRFLAQSLLRTDSNGVVRAKPQARKARPASTQVNGDGTARSQVNASPWNLPSSQRIFQHLGSRSNLKPSGPTSLSSITALFHLLTAFGTLKAVEREDVDPLWTDAVRTRDLEKKICEAFSDDGMPENGKDTVTILRLLLLSKCHKWAREIT